LSGPAGLRSETIVATVSKPEKLDVQRSDTFTACSTPTHLALSNADSRPPLTNAHHVTYFLSAAKIRIFKGPEIYMKELEYSIHIFSDSNQIAYLLTSTHF
jgi:hypothetical protein